MLLIIALNIFREMAPKAKSNITLICGLLVFLFIARGLSFLVALRNAARWMDRLKCISLHVRPAFKHPFTQRLEYGPLPACAAAGAGCGVPWLLLPIPTAAPLSLGHASTTFCGALLHASDLGCVRKTCKEKEMGPSSSKAAILWRYCLRGEAFCTLLPVLHKNGRGRLWKSRAWAAVRYLEVMTNIWRFVLQGLTHLYKFWVRLPGVSPVASKELYLFILAKNLALYFLICPHLSPPPVALVLPGLFLPLTLPVLDDYDINRDSSWGWGSLPAN